MKKKSIQVVIAFIIFVAALINPLKNEFINNIIFLLDYLIVGFSILKKAIKNIYKGKIFDENFLMSIATIGAIIVGEFSEAVGVMLFYQVGELFQNYAVNKSRKSIASLMDIRPDYANIKRNGNIEKVKPDDVKIGEEILVRVGERVPLDGIIIEGISMVDMSMLTGESVPKRIGVGDEILSGTINKDAVISIKVTKEYEDSTVNKILNLVENASSRKSKSEKFITKFARYYTPIVVIIAIILGIIIPLIMDRTNFYNWIYRALTFLVVSCPCALVISIPLSFFGGIGGASKLGILIKGSNYLEALSKIETIVFDKTGTLTKGVFEVQKVETIGMSNENLLKIAAYAENNSNHPIAISIKKAYCKEIDNKIVTEERELAGYGISSIIDGDNVLVGNIALMKKNNIDCKEYNEYGTIVYIAVNNKFAGYILISDKIKDDSREAIEKIKKSNIKNIVMLTGDRRSAGENVAREIGIQEVYAELLPDEKVKEVEELIKNKSKNSKVAFVGDGINDAPVLAISDVGIAMGGLGTDAAIEAADVIIMTDEPSKIFDSIKISKKTMRIVKQNIIFAITIKVIVLILSAFGLSNMWEAVFADVGVSVLAILNALRMLKVN